VNITIYGCSCGSELKNALTLSFVPFPKPHEIVIEGKTLSVDGGLKWIVSVPDQSHLSEDKDRLCVNVFGQEHLLEPEHVLTLAELEQEGFQFPASPS
jgi:hypothetical protein